MTSSSLREIQLSRSRDPHGRPYSRSMAHSQMCQSERAMSSSDFHVQVEVDHQRAVTYAYLNCTRNVISRIAVRNVGVDSTVGRLVWPRVTVEAPFDESVAGVWEGEPQELPRPAAVDPPLVTWTRVAPAFNPRLLGRLAERANASLRVELLADDAVIWSSMFPISLLAANEWLHDPNYYDSLAAFVLPTSVALRPVLDRARVLLQESTGNGSTPGYQLEARGVEVSRQRVYEMAAAAYEAIREIGLNYSNPPGSFETAVQRIRSPQTVMDERAATCLDSTVLYAAALAQFGLQPVIFLVKGHAFAGFSVFEAPLFNAPAVVDGRAEVQQLIERGFVQPVETTTLCGGPNSKPFHDALSAPLDYFGVDVAEFRSMIVVQSAWRFGIAPPPSVNDALLEETEGDHPAHALQRGGSLPAMVAPVFDDYEFDGGAGSTGDRPPPRVRQWMASLLDLSSRNSLLRMSVRQKNGKETTRYLEFDVPPSTLGAIDDLLFTPRSKLVIHTPADLPGRYKTSGITLEEFTSEIPSLKSPLMYPSYTRINDVQAWVSEDIRDRDRGKIDRGLTDLDIERLVMLSFEAECESQLGERANKIRSLADETMLATGSNPLHLALGVLTWSEQSPGRGGQVGSVEYAAPLFLYPVVLDGGKGAPYTLRLDGSGAITPNYCLQEKLRRPPYNLELPELSTPLTDASGIDLDKMLASIQNKLRDAKLSNFAVQRRCVLGVFDYSTFRLWKDLHDNWRTMRDTSAVVRHLMYTPGQPMSQHAVEVTSLDPYCPIEADDSQVEAIRWALAGRSFRLEGPPGTGKTQTITNLIASCLAHGRKILFVAEKQTALQQVKKRLHSIGLGDYCLELHAKGDSDTRLRKNISEQVGGAMESAADTRSNEWDDLSARAGLEQRALDDYRAALHELNDADLSLWKAREGLAALGDGPTVAVPRNFLEQYKQHWPRFREIEFELPNVIEVAGGLTANPWRLVDRLDFEGLDRGALTTLIAEAKSALEEFNGLGGIWESVRSARRPEELEVMVSAARLSAEGYALAEGAFARGVGGAAWVQLAGSFRVELSASVSAVTPHLSLLGAGFAFRADLAQIDAACIAASSAKWPLTGRRLRELQELIGGAAIEADPKEVLAAVVASQRLLGPLRDSVQRARQDLHLSIPDDCLGHLESMLQRFDHTIETVAGLEGDQLSTSARDLARSLVTASNIGELETRIVSRFVEAWRRLATLLGVEESGLSRWRGDRSLVGALMSALGDWEADRGEQNRYLRLQRWSAVAATANGLIDCGLSSVRSDVLNGVLDVHQLGPMVQRGVLTAAIEERLEAGKIDNFDGRSHDRRIANFERTLAQLREVMTERIPGLIVERRQQARRSLSGANSETANLLRELKPLRGEKTPIRTLLAKYGAALVDTMPCFMMSPDSVATLLPVDAVKFDLVIFDEASQVKTPHAVGALGRGVANIVVGDSKQMPPTSAFSANAGRFEQADEDEDVDAHLTNDQGQVEGAEEIETGVGDEVGTEVLIGAAARDVESILQEFEASNVPHLQLLCHYRSKDELLIAFSNAEIYEKPMLTFPSTSGLASTALEFRRVDGQFHRKRTALPDPRDPSRKLDLIRTNPAEAQAVVDEVLARLRDPLRRANRERGKRSGAESIIVVTFNKPQQELIKLLLEFVDDPADPVVARALLEEKDDETGVLIADPQLKIRNLETVQGDEAETVIFSVAFSRLAPDERKAASNRVPLNFGPVTQDGGHRRLNVAVTRAQRKMIVFCSFDPIDMEVKPTSSEGARLVQKFLLLAKNGPRLNGDIGVGASRSKHIDDIARSVEALGYRVQTQMGLSSLRVDIAVGLPNSDEWSVAILADGLAWAERGSAYQRELLPKNILHSLGWKHVIRLWLPSWIEEREAVLTRIKNALAEIESGAHDVEEFEVGDPTVLGAAVEEVPSVGVTVGALLDDDEPLDEPRGLGVQGANNEDVPAVDLPSSREPESLEVIDEEPDVIDLPRRRVIIPSLTSRQESHANGNGIIELTFVPYVPTVKGGVGILDLMGSGTAKKQVMAVIDEVLTIEAPIVAERLGRLVANSFSLNTVKQARIDAIVELVAKGKIEVTDLGTVIWQSSEQKKSWNCYRTSTGDELRRFEEIPLPELRCALVAVVAAIGDLSIDDAMRAVASKYGKKVGPKIRMQLEAVIESSQSRRLVTRHGDRLQLRPTL
jgi:hypothetical protein